MLQQTANIKPFNDLITVLNTSIEFYEKAIDKVNYPQVKTLLGKIHAQHSSSINTIATYVGLVDGENEDGSSFSVETRNIYSQALSTLQSDPDLSFIDQLEEVEHKILTRLNGINEADLPLRAQIAVTKTRSESELAHNVIKLLQKVRQARLVH